MGQELLASCRLCRGRAGPQVNISPVSERFDAKHTSGVLRGRIVMYTDITEVGAIRLLHPGPDLRLEWLPALPAQQAADRGIARLPNRARQPGPARRRQPTWPIATRRSQ